MLAVKASNSKTYMAEHVINLLKMKQHTIYRESSSKNHRNKKLLEEIDKIMLLYVRPPRARLYMVNEMTVSASSLFLKLKSKHF